MKVLYVTNLPAPYKVDFFNALAANIDLTVAYERETATDRDSRWYGDEKNRAFREVFTRGIKVGADSSCSLGVVRLLRRQRFDAVVMNGFSSPTAILTVLYMICHKIPYCIMCDGMLPHAVSRLKAKLKRFMISHADYCLSSNDLTTELLASYGAKREHIHRYNFSSVKTENVDVEPSDKSVFKRLIGFPDEKLVLYIGQFIHRKGIDVLIDAYKELRTDARLILVGGSRESLESLCDLPNGRITVNGFMKPDALEFYLRAADLLVLPTRYDIWGLVVGEALSKGLPVVTTDNCGAGLAMVRDGVNGYIVPVGDATLLSEKIDAILECGDGMREAAIKSARGYTIETMAARTYEILRSEVDG